MRHRHEKWEAIAGPKGNELISLVKNHFISHGLEKERLRKVPIQVITPRNSWLNNRAPVRHPVKGLIFVGHSGVTIDSKTQTKSPFNEPSTQIEFHTDQDEENRDRQHIITFPNKAPVIYVDDDLAATTKVLNIKYEDIHFDNGRDIIPDQLLIVSSHIPGRKILSQGRNYQVQIALIILEDNFYREIVADKNNPGLRNLKKVNVLPVNFIPDNSLRA